VPVVAPRRRKIAAVPSGSSPERTGLAGKIETTLGALPLTSADAALGELALTYGRVLDRVTAGEPDDQVKAVSELGPRLLAVLVELGGTPRSRAKDRPAPQSSALTALRGELA
jgi:hypothetical protein